MNFFKNYFFIVVINIPSHCSGASHNPDAVRQTVPAAARESVGHTGDDPKIENNNKIIIS